MSAPLSVLFVCLGNICRSPTAEAVFRQRLQQRGLDGRITVDSAGTGDWHIGRAPDPRTVAAAARRGYDLSPLRARQVEAADFHRFDWLLAMDRSNLHDLRQLRPATGRAELALFLSAAGLAEAEVPDPYYGGADGFTRVLDLVETASDAWIAALEARL